MAKKTKKSPRSPKNTGAIKASPLNTMSAPQVQEKPEEPAAPPTEGGSTQDVQQSGGDKESISDGFHTFDELYEHRNTLFMALCKAMQLQNKPVWRTQYYSNGTHIEGWFLLGINKDQGRQITYHLPMSKWDDCSFARVMERAPEFDGHISADVVERISKLKFTIQ
jgi:hypothetical protein